MHSRVASIAAAAFLLGCASTLPEGDADGQLPTTAAREFYDAYEAALRAHQRDTLADFYSSDGALIVLDGSRQMLTNAAIDSRYREGWQGPQFFAFDSLHFDAIGDHVMVTGSFRWLAPQSADTAHYVYLSLLERTPAGLKIRLEHETSRSTATPP